MTTKPHEALSLSLAERVDYLTIVASMAGADVVLDPTETARLRALCAELELPEQQTEAVLTASQRATSKVERHLEALKDSPLRFALLSDCVSLAYADGEYRKEEQAEVRGLARALAVSDEQVAAIEEFCRSLRDAAAGKGDGHESAGAEIGRKLAAAGIPAGILATASAVGLEMAGVSSGLAAFGAGLGIATGFGAVFGLGVGTFLGVRWLKQKLREKAE